MLLKGHCLYSFIQKVIEMTDFLLLNARTGIIDCYYKNTFYNNRMNDFICLPMQAQQATRFSAKMDGSGVVNGPKGLFGS